MLAFQAVFGILYCFKIYLLSCKTVYKGDYSVHQHCPGLKDLKGS